MDTPCGDDEMITLRMNPYSDREKEFIADLLSDLRSDLLRKCPQHQFEYKYCDDCPVRHVCYDVIQVAEYARKMATEVKR